MENVCRAAQDTDNNMAHARCWISKAKHRHAEYVILITFPLQQWFPERFSMLHVHYLFVCTTNSDRKMRDI